MDEWTRRLIALMLVIIANMAPWAVDRLLGPRYRAPLDLGATLADGERVFGAHKTWRGLAAGALACGLAAWIVGLGFVLGVAFGALALIADAASSFVKRRLRRAPGYEYPLLDQLPEALLPLIVLSRPLGLGILECIAIAFVFFLLDLAVTGVRHLGEPRA
jgi:CDP-2,3-bis-(O-geranylgeranyl)-sn-glycerol synthase